MKAHDLNRQLKSLQRAGDATSAHEALRLVNRYTCEKHLKSKYFATNDQSILANKLERSQRAWIKGLQQPHDISTGPSRYDVAMGGLPIKDHYRLYIDRDRQRQGPKCFDVREPGYARAMREAFVLVRELIGKPLTVESYRMIHDAAVEGVFDKRHGYFMEQGLGVGTTVYGMKIKEITWEARREWDTEKLIATRQKGRRPDPDYLAYFHHRNGVSPSVPPPGDKALMRRRLETVLDQYNTAINRADSDLEKKRAIARACRSLEIAHFFDDGNQRTVAFLVLNKMLIENALSPVILPNPFVFDGYLSVDQLVGEIHKGQVIFQEYVR